MTSATIRAARTSDSAEIAELTTQFGYELTQADAADRRSRILLRDDQQFFVADVNGRAVGGCTSSGQSTWTHNLGLGGLVVDGKHPRLGIGRALMDRAEAWARERGCSVVRLTSSAGRNAAHCSTKTWDTCTSRHRESNPCHPQVIGRHERSYTFIHDQVDRSP